ncbi:MAG: MFS transporter [Ornithinimicrobium sp.]
MDADFGPEAGLVLLPAGVAMFLAALLGGRWADRVGYPVPTTAVLLLSGVGALAFLFVDTSTSAPVIAALAVILGLGTGAAFTTSSAAGMSAVPHNLAREAGGILSMSRYVGCAFVVSLSSLVTAGVIQAQRQLGSRWRHHVT